MPNWIISKQDSGTVAINRTTQEIVAQHADTSTVFNEIIAKAGNEGAHISIDCGKFLLNNAVLIPSRVSIQGSGRGTILEVASENSDSAAFIAREADSIVISDLTIQADSESRAKCGIIFHDCIDCEIRSVYARDFAEYGIVARDSSFMNKILNCTTSGNGKAGIGLVKNNSGRGGDWVPNLIMGCSSTGEKGSGIVIEKSFCTNIVGCQVYQAQKHGIYILEHSNSTCVSASRVYQCKGNGILVHQSHELNVSSNIICWNQGHGIECEFLYWGTISANNFIDNGGRVEPKTYGIYLHTDTKSVQVSGNAVFNWPGHNPMIAGIYETDDCANNSIVGNTVHYYTDEAVVSKGKNTIVESIASSKPCYPHPSKGPFPKPQEISLWEPISFERVQAFLHQSRI